MFTNEEKKDLIQEFKRVLEENKAGRPDTRDGLADLLAETARKYLAGRYNTKPASAKEIGIHTTRDTISKDDFGR